MRRQLGRKTEEDGLSVLSHYLTSINFLGKSNYFNTVGSAL
jgi:hypothetical protein